MSVLDKGLVIDMDKTATVYVVQIVSKEAFNINKHQTALEKSGRCRMKGKILWCINNWLKGKACGFLLH